MNEQIQKSPIIIRMHRFKTIHVIPPLFLSLLFFLIIAFIFFQYSITVKNILGENVSKEKDTSLKGTENIFRNGKLSAISGLDVYGTMNIHDGLEIDGKPVDLSWLLKGKNNQIFQQSVFSSQTQADNLQGATGSDTINNYYTTTQILSDSDTLSLLSSLIETRALNTTSLSFSDITNGINSSVLTIGNDSLLSATGTGTINATKLLDNTWERPGAIGIVTPSTGAFTNVTTTGQTIFSSLGSGIAHIDDSGILSSSKLSLSGADISGVLPLALGGTSATTAADARINLGLIAGGDGDVWVKKSGDTMTGNFTTQGYLYVQGAKSLIVYNSNNTKNVEISHDDYWSRITDSNGSGIVFNGGTIQFEGTSSVNVKQDLTLMGITSAIRTNANKNISLIPDGIGYTIIGDSGISSHTFNTNDDLFVSGRLEVDGQTYFDNHVRIGGASLCVNSSNTACAGGTAGTIYASNTTVQSADVAENYISSQKLEQGDIVMPAGSSDQAVTKSRTPYQSQAIGIVSSSPGVTLNSDARTDEKHPYLYPIALSGRVPVKVSTENGAIAVGDLLTTSSIPGVAMKATKNGTSIGKALQAYNGSKVTKISAFVTLSSILPDTIAISESNFDLPSLKSQIASLSASILDLNDFGSWLSRLTILEQKVASSISEREQLTGKGIIQKGTDTVEVPIAEKAIDAQILVTANALIDTPLVVIDKKETSFIVAIAKAPDKDIPFDWLLIK